MVELKPRRDRHTYAIVANLDQCVFELQRDLDKANSVNVEQAMRIDALAKRLHQAETELKQLRLLLAAPRIVTVGATNGGENNG